MGTVFSPGPSVSMVLLSKTRLSEVEGSRPHLDLWCLLSNRNGGFWTQTRPPREVLVPRVPQVFLQSGSR